MTNQVTPASELAAKIEANRYDYFTFPILDITIKYRTPDLLTLSYNKSLPTFLADAVIDGYKKSLSGVDPKQYTEERAKQGVVIDDKVMQDMASKGYTLLSELCVSNTIIDGQSDLENGVISYKDIPEGDAIAFLYFLLNKASISKTNSGGEITSEDVTEFPDSKRKSKRRTAGANG